jgi:heme A synthase
MNAGSLYLQEITAMRSRLFIKFFLVLPLILLADYILMALLGCTTCLFGLGNEFYCGPFCVAGKIILVLSVIIFGSIIYPDIKKMIKSKKDATTTKSQESI